MAVTREPADWLASGLLPESRQKTRRYCLFEWSWLLHRLGDLGFLSSQRAEDLAWMAVDDLMVKVGASTDFGWWLDDVALLYDRPPQKLVDRVLAAYREALTGFGPVMKVFNSKNEKALRQLLT